MQDDLLEVLFGCCSRKSAGDERDKNEQQIPSPQMNVLANTGAQNIFWVDDVFIPSGGIYDSPQWTSFSDWGKGEFGWWTGGVRMVFNDGKYSNFFQLFYHDKNVAGTFPRIDPVERDVPTDQPDKARPEAIWFRLPAEENSLTEITGTKKEDAPTHLPMKLIDSYGTGKIRIGGEVLPLPYGSLVHPDMRLISAIGVFQEAKGDGASPPDVHQEGWEKRWQGWRVSYWIGGSTPWQAPIEPIEFKRPLDRWYWEPHSLKKRRLQGISARTDWDANVVDDLLIESPEVTQDATPSYFLPPMRVKVLANAILPGASSDMTTREAYIDLFSDPEKPEECRIREVWWRGSVTSDDPLMPGAVVWQHAKVLEVRHKGALGREEPAEDERFTAKLGAPWWDRRDSYTAWGSVNAAMQWYVPDYPWVTIAVFDRGIHPTGAGIIPKEVSSLWRHMKNIYIDSFGNVPLYKQRIEKLVNMLKKYPSPKEEAARLDREASKVFAELLRRLDGATGLNETMSVRDLIRDHEGSRRNSVLVSAWNSLPEEERLKLFAQTEPRRACFERIAPLPKGFVFHWQAFTPFPKDTFSGDFEAFSSPDGGVKSVLHWEKSMYWGAPKWRATYTLYGHTKTAELTMGDIGFNNLFAKKGCSWAALRAAPKWLEREGRWDFSGVIVLYEDGDEVGAIREDGSLKTMKRQDFEREVLRLPEGVRLKEFDYYGYGDHSWPPQRCAARVARVGDQTLGDENEWARVSLIAWDAWRDAIATAPPEGTQDPEHWYWAARPSTRPKIMPDSAPKAPLDVGLADIGSALVPTPKGEHPGRLPDVEVWSEEDGDWNKTSLPDKREVYPPSEYPEKIDKNVVLVGKKFRLTINWESADSGRGFDI